MVDAPRGLPLHHVSMITEDFIREALKQVKYPGFSRDIISFGLVKEVCIGEAETIVRLEVQTRCLLYTSDAADE